MKFSSKCFLVTGGAGFIGSAIAKELYRKNSEIVILDDFSAGKKDNLPFECSFVENNVSDQAWMNKVNNIDYVLHFAAPSSVVLFKKSQNRCITDTVLGIANVFEYAKRFGVKKVVFPSSSSVYGNTPLPQSENTPTAPINMYGVTKLTCEYMARLYSNFVPSVGLRIFAGYGPGETHKGEIASVITLFMDAIGKRSKPIIFGDGSQSRDFVYISDIVESVLKSIENDFAGIINVGSGESHTFIEVVDLINHALGTSISPHYIEKPAQYFERTRAEITKMKKILGIIPTNLDDGLKKYLEARENILEK